VLEIEPERPDGSGNRGRGRGFAAGHVRRLRAPGATSPPWARLRTRPATTTGRPPANAVRRARSLRRRSRPHAALAARGDLEGLAVLRHRPPGDLEPALLREAVGHLVVGQGVGLVLLLDDVTH